MATNAVIGSLRANLGLDSAQFNKGLNQAQTRLQSFGTQMAKIGAAAAAALTAAFAGMAVAVKGAIDEADRLGKMAQQVGIPVEELSKLKHAADLSGVSLESLAVSVGRLNRNMLDVASGVGQSVARAFDQLGISVKNADGTLKTSTAVMAEVAQRFARMEDGAAKSALAMQLFGRSGAQLIPLLNQGEAGLAAMTAEAERLGIVIDTKTSKAAEAFNDNLTRLRAVWDGMVMQVTAQILPALENLSTRLIDAAKNADIVGKVSEAFKAIMPGVASVIAEVAVSVHTLANELTALGRAIALIGSGEFSRAFETIRQAGEDTTRAFAGLEQFKKSLFAEEIKTTWQDMATATDRFTVSLGELSDVGEAGGEAIARGMKRASVAVKDVGVQASATFDYVADGVQRVGSAVQSAFGSVIDSAIDGTFRLQDAIGNLLKDLAKLALNNAFQSLIGGATGGGGFFASLLGGLTGFAQGGSFKVGGSGGIDSQVVAFRASPGEMVDVRTPGQEGDAAVVHIHVSASEWFDARVEKVAGPVSVKSANAVMAGAERQRQRDQLRGG